MIRTLGHAFLIAAACLATTSAIGQSQSSVNASAARDAQAADDALNAEYRAAVSRLSPANRLMLRDSQRAWISFRDKECTLVSAGVRGGSAYPMIHSICTRDLTNERTRQLAKLARCQEGDLSCPR